MAPVLTVVQLSQFGGFVRILAYPTAHALAFISFVGLTLWLYRRETGAVAPALDVLLAAIPAGLLGSTLLGALTSGLIPPFRLSSLWGGYRSAYGGLLAGGAAGWLVMRWQGLPQARFLDCATPGLAVGVFWCRAGCFLAGCCWGRPTKSFLGLAFPFDHPGMLALPQREGWKLLPTQLYLAAAALVILCLAIARRRRPGEPAGSSFRVALNVYAFTTLSIEFLRADLGRRFFAGLSHNQWISLAILAVSLAFRPRRRSEPDCRASLSSA